MKEDLKEKIIDWEKELDKRFTYYKPDKVLRCSYYTGKLQGVASELKSFINHLLSLQKQEIVEKIGKMIRIDGCDVLRGDYYLNENFREGYIKANKDIKKVLKQTLTN